MKERYRREPYFNHLETLYRDYLEHDLLDEVGELSLRFTYLPVQAYCCAKAIMASNDRERILGDIISMLGTATRLRWWEETLAFICGLMSEGGELESLRKLLTTIAYNPNLLEGEYDLSDDRVVLLRNTADAYQLGVGDVIQLSYVMPVPREEGKTQAENISVNRISRTFDLRGPSHLISTGCTSSTDALGVALDRIRLGRAERVLAGGVDAPVAPGILAAFEVMRVISPSWSEEPERASRPFDCSCATAVWST
mgnify:CR=1 FL=1